MGKNWELLSEAATGGKGVFFKIAAPQLYWKHLKNNYEGAQFLIKLQAVGLLELNSFTGFLYRFLPLDTLQNTYFVEHLIYNTRYSYIFKISKPKISFASFIHKNYHSIVISPVLTMEKILPAPNWKHCIKLEVDGFKKILVRRIECKMGGI